MKLENACLCVEIAEKGAELTRIFNKKTGAEILWIGECRFQNSGFPFHKISAPECREDTWKYCSDQRNTVSDVSAWICKRQPVSLCKICSRGSAVFILFE